MIDDRSKLPDHNILLFSFETESVVINTLNKESPLDTFRCIKGEKKYKLKEIPDDFLQDDNIQNTFLEMSTALQLGNESQIFIDDINDTFVNVLKRWIDSFRIISQNIKI